MDARRHHRQVSLLATILAGVLLLAGAIPTFAGDTRNVFVGSPGAADGTLTYTAVSAGGATRVDVLISNDSKATMNKTSLTIGTFPAPALPDGVTVKAIFGPDKTATNCPIADDGRSATCSFGDLASGKKKNVSILFRMGGSDATIEVAVKVKETVNDNGANKDTFFASANVSVQGSSCDAVATYTAPGAPETVSTESEACTPQSTRLDVPGLANGAEVQISEVGDTSCLKGMTCFGLASTASVNRGNPVALVWTITWQTSSLPKSFNIKKLVILHTEDDGKVVKIANTSQGQCGTSTTKTNCIVSAGFVGTNLVVSFRTPKNGKIKGAF